MSIEKYDLENKIAELGQDLEKEKARSKDYESAMESWKEKCAYEADINAELTEQVQRYREALERIANYKAETLTDQYYALSRHGKLAREALNPESVREIPNNLGGGSERWLST